MTITLALFLLGTVACNHTADNITRTAPNFTLKDLSGRDVSLVDFEGKVVLVDFWAMWCPPCRKSIPELVSLQEQYREEGLVIIGISLDDPKKADDRSLIDFKKLHRINYPVLRGADVFRVVEDYFVDEKLGIPTLFVIDRKGVIVDRHVGFFPGVLEDSLLSFF
ncbi:MAG: TlpA disulfide reductase family protein [Desulfatiglandales bacterium]